MIEHFSSKDSELIPQTDREWTNVLRRLQLLDVEIVEFIPQVARTNHWILLVKSIANSKKIVKASQSFNKRLNRDLKNGFKMLGALKLGHWDKYFSKFKMAGFYVPIDDIQRVNPDIINSHLYFYQFLLKHFRYQDFFLSLRNSKNFEMIATTWLLMQSGFTYFIILNFYISLRIIHTVFLRNMEIGIQSYWMSMISNRRLPSEQITILLLIRCESLVSKTSNRLSMKSIFSKASNEVVSFFEKFKDDIDLLFSDAEIEFNPDELSDSQLNLKDAFTAIFLRDKEEFMFQEILDDQSKLGINSALPLMLQLRFGVKSLYNVSGVIKDKILNTEERPAGLFAEDDNQLPRFKSIKNIVYPENVQYWYDIIPEKRREIVDLVRAKLPYSLVEKSTEVIKIRCQNHWVNLINLITAPVLVWKKEDKGIYPQWNLLDDEEARNLKALYKQRQKNKADEKKLLERHLRTIFKLKSLQELTEYQAQHKPKFTYDKFQLQWSEEFNRMINKFNQREKFYENKMKEFGIYESELNGNEKKVLLQEMLKIDDEVKPYVAYVKKAFQTALPIRKRITFSDYRHVSDGVEFDADTLFDHEKWIRADVMKVMGSKVERGEAIQINTFCLDYSGSMKHDRMRNLFKMLYLLILGLEDRKSYDAFHFFSNNFIDVVEFSKDFTNKKVLFKIMRQISSTELGKVHFFGMGGTNMSDGIKVSHKKMKEFAEEFRKTNPNANIVSSIFVITDGQPSLGITEIPLLNEFIETKRQDGDVEIKGIFIKSEDDVSVDLMEEIFGENNFIETADFTEGVNKFVKIMTETYKQQRRTFKWKQKRRKLGLTE